MHGRTFSLSAAAPSWVSYGPRNADTYPGVKPSILTVNSVRAVTWHSPYALFFTRLAELTAKSPLFALKDPSITNQLVDPGRIVLGIVSRVGGFTIGEEITGGDGGIGFVSGGVGFMGGVELVGKTGGILLLLSSGRMSGLNKHRATKAPPVIKLRIRGII